MDKSKRYKQTLDQINALIQDSKDILEVNINDEVVFFLVNEFAPPVGGTVQALPYMTFKGVCIDDFLLNSVYVQSQIKEFINSFNAKKYDNQMIHMQFSQNHHWRYYSNSR